MVTPISLHLFRRWIEPINPDGTPMQIGDEKKDWSWVGRRPDQAVAASADEMKPKRYRAPYGARLCDMLCFPDNVRVLEDPLLWADGGGVHRWIYTS